MEKQNSPSEPLPFQDLLLTLSLDWAQKQAINPLNFRT